MVQQSLKRDPMTTVLSGRIDNKYAILHLENSLYDSRWAVSFVNGRGNVMGLT